jgi:hypothetical protein
MKGVLFLATAMVGVAIAYGVSAQSPSADEPVLHVQKWSDLTCEVGDPVIRMFPRDRRIDVRCE